jgi:predicted nucleotidyltransferase
MGEPLIDIRPDHWVIVRDILQRHVPQFEVWAFGSRATWKAKEYSDLELTEKLRKSTTVDWQKRESIRARLRNRVRITLRRYKYPSDKQEEAIRLVLDQAERLSDAWTR